MATHEAGGMVGYASFMGLVAVRPRSRRPLTAVISPQPESLGSF